MFRRSHGGAPEISSGARWCEQTRGLRVRTSEQSTPDGSESHQDRSYAHSFGTPTNSDAITERKLAFTFPRHTNQINSVRHPPQVADSLEAHCRSRVTPRGPQSCATPKRVELFCGLPMVASFQRKYWSERRFTISGTDSRVHHPVAEHSRASLISWYFSVCRTFEE